MQFDKINFVLNVLSSERLLSGSQNYIKLFVVDSIAETPILRVEYKIQETDGRNTATVIQDWTELYISGTFYEHSFTPTLTKSGTLEMLVKIIDTQYNTYLLSTTMEGVK